MKSILTVLGIMLLISLDCLGQTSTTAAPSAREYNAQGIKVSIVRPSLTFQAKSSYNDSYQEVTTKIVDSTIGLSLGYVQLPIKEIGWTTNLTYLNLSSANGDGGSILRADGNVAYTFIKELNLKAGVNLNQITSESERGYGVGLGYQGSIGFQVSKNFGMDLGYTEMNASSQRNYQTTANISGIELAANFVF